MTTQTYDTDPKQKLYDTVKEKGLYTKSFDEFKAKYSTPEAIENLYNVVNKRELFTKSKDEFLGKYFAEPVKKKESGNSPLQSSGVDLSKRSEPFASLYMGTPVENDTIEPMAFSKEQEKQFLANKQRFEDTTSAKVNKPVAETVRQTVPKAIKDGVIKDKVKDEGAVGYIFNTVVDGVAELVAGLPNVINPITDGAEDLLDKAMGTPGFHKSMRENNIPINTMSLPRGDELRKDIQGLLHVGTTYKAPEFDVTNGVQASDVESMAVQAPRQLLDMAYGAVTGGGSFFLQSVSQNAKELAENPEAEKLTPIERMGYLYTQGIVQAALEKFSLNKILKSTGLSQKASQTITKEIIDEFSEKGVKATAKEIQELAVKKASTFSAKLKKFGAKAGTSAGVEGVTEGLQTAASQGGKLLLNKIHGSEVFNEADITKNFLKDVINSGVQGGAFGGVVGGGVGVLQNTNKAIREQVAQAQTPADIEKIRTDIAEQVELGNITQEEADAANITADQYAKVAAKIPSDVSPEQKYAIIGGIEQREGIKKEIEKIKKGNENLDPAFHESSRATLSLLEAKLEQTNDYLEGVIAGKKPTYRKEKPTTEGGEEKYYKTSPSGEETKITKEHYDLATAVREDQAAKNKEVKEAKDDILETLKSKAGEFEKGETLQYFTDKAGEAPAQYYEKYGKEITDKLLENVSTEKLKQNIDDLLTIDAGNPNVPILDKLIAERESTSSTPMQTTTEGAAENVVPSTSENISQPIELDPNLPDGYELPMQHVPQAEVNLPKIQTNETKAEDTNIPIQAEKEISIDAETNKEGSAAGEGTGEPPTGGAVVPVTEEGRIGGITQAANAVRRKDRELPEFQKNPQSFEQWNNEAERLLKEGYDVEALMKRLEKEADATPVENAIRKIYYATIDAEVAKNPTNELLALQKRAAIVGDAVNRRAGQNLVSLKGEGSPLSSISDFYVAKMEAVGADTLTEAQKKEVKEQYEAVKKADADAEAKLAALEAENARLKAEVELAKTSKSTTKKATKEKRTHEDYVKERESFRDELKAAKEKHEKWLKGQGIQKSGVGFTLTTDMVKAISKIVRSHVDENVTKLKDVVEKVLEDIKDIFPDITEKDIHNVIAGEYNEKKPTRNELAAKMRDLKDEAFYVNKLERLLSGTEPKSEKDKIKRNQQITDLRKKIEEFKKDETAANKFYGESDAGNRRLEKLEDELERIQERKQKEKPEKGSKEEREISATEQKLLDEIEAEQAKWDAENDAAKVAKKEYRRLETERNRQIERVDFLKKKLKSISDGNLPERGKREKKADTPEIDKLKEEIVVAEKFIRSAKATQEKIRKQEVELQRLKDRKEKEPTEVNKKSVTDREKELKEQIASERKEFEKEKREANKFYTDETPEEVRKLRAIKRSNEKQTAAIQERISKGEFETKKEVPFLENPELKRKFPKQYKDTLDAILAREEARHEFDIALMKDEMAKRSLAKKGIDVLGDIIGTTKSVVTGIDASGIGIQNLVAMAAHPRSAIEALPASFVDFGSAKNQERWLASVHNSELYPIAKKAGLDITEPQSLKSSEKEEIFTHNLLDRKIKFKGKTYIISKYTTKPFERIFTGLGNRMRWNLWARGVEKLMAEGITYEKHPEEYEALAKVLNTETGRGKLHPQVDKAFEFISAGIWSPRLMASRMNILGIGDVGNLIAGGKKGYYGGLTPRMRAYALKDLAKFIIFGSAFLGFAGLTFADEVDTDPNSATFGTMLVNGKRYNIWGGFTQYVRLIAKYAMGGEKQKGVFKESNPLVTTGRFLWSKTTPAVGVGISVAHKDRQGVSRDYMGKPVTATSALENLITPLSIKGISEGVKKEGLGSILWTGLPSFVGLNVSYESDFSDSPPSSSTQKQSKSNKKTEKKQSKAN